jgi:hypothetical protein
MADITGMLQAAAGVGGAEETDPNFNQTVLLLHGDGTNGAQNNTFLDSSTNNFTITRNGNTTQGTFSPFSLAAGEFSNFFDGTGDYLTTPATGQFAPTGDFTVGHWVYFTSLAAAYQMTVSNYEGNNATDWAIEIQSDGALNFYTNGAAIRIQSSSGAIVANQWHYISFSRSGSTITGYLDGVSVGTYTQSGTFGTATKTIAIGARKNNTELVSGYISNVILIDGSAVTSVPTSPSTAVSGTELLTCQSNRFVDNSSNAFAITVNGNTSIQPFSPFAPTAAYSASVNGGSGYFDGTGDYLTAGSASDWTFLHNGAQDYTIEAFVYLTATPAIQSHIVSTNSAPASAGYRLYIDSSLNIISAYTRGVTGSTLSVTSSSAITLNQWYYIAVTFTDSTDTCAIYINGVSSNSGVITAFSASAPPNTLNIGRNPSDGGGLLTGYISNLRISDSVRAISSTPTAPYTSDANTELLCNFTNAGIFDNTGKNNLETVGNAQIDTTTKKYGTGSMEFDGTGDYLKKVVDPQYFIGTGDFTVECWVYPTTLNNYNMIFGYSSPDNYWAVRSTGYLSFYDGTANKTSASNPVLVNEWTHIAVSRSGTTLKQFVNGTEVYSDTVSASIGAASGTIWFGGSAAYPTSNFFTGFIDDLRITKGVARYTATFTPPTAAFPDQ